VTLSRCAWCGQKLAAAGGPGRPRRYCRRSCRQRDYEARQRAAELGLGEHELIVARTELNALRDRLYILACAIDDFAQAEPFDRDRLLDDLLHAARESVRTSVHASADA
jgi:class 3 adenylate cyclase